PFFRVSPQASVTLGRPYLNIKFKYLASK
ncbi:hypothetical protein MIMGU_mgv1a0259052mg, partial [Erythranthe guttata]